MQTSLYKISFKDGSIFKVFCANNKQNKEILSMINKWQLEKKIKKGGLMVVECGIHTMKQFKMFNK